MASQYRWAKELEVDAARAFGRMLRRWREINGWTQYTAERWAEESGFILLRHSNLSGLENGKNQPRFRTFLCLAEINRRLAAQDFSGVRSRELKDLLVQAQPLTDDSGLVWGPAQFWECHHGLRAVPSKYQVVTVPAPVLSVEQAKELSNDWRTRVLKAALQADMKAIEMLSQVSKLPPASERDRFQAVVGGMIDYTAEDLATLWDGSAQEWLPEVWVRKWRDTLNPAPILPLGGEGRQQSTI